MAPSAARAIATVVAEVCDMDSSTTPLHNIQEQINFLLQLDFAMAGSPDAETVTGVDRAIKAGARHLSALGTRLAAVVRRGNAAAVTTIEQQLTLACTLAANLGGIAANHRLVGAAPALCGCVTLPLECGHALMTRAAVSGFEISRNTADILQSQARLLAVLMGPHLGHRALAAQLVAPEPLLAWLSATASTTLALRDRGPPPMVALCFASLVNIIDESELFQPHYLALQRDIGLQRSLVQVLVPALHKAAVAMLLPPNHRPDDVDWPMIGEVVCVLMTSVLADQFEKQIASGAGVSSVAQRVLHSASQLFAAAPASCHDELSSSKFAALWHILAALLGVTCSTQQHQQQESGAAVPDAQRQKTARLLLQVLSRLPTALRVEAESCQQDAAGSAGAENALLIWRSVLHTMHQLSVPEPGLSADVSTAAANGVCSYHTIDSLAEVPAWCSAGTALLQALPHAATLVVLALHQPAGEQPNTEIVQNDPLGILMCTVASSIVGEVARYCSTIGNGGPWSAADAAAAIKALWQLHTTLCRCIHSIAAGSLPTAAFPVSMPILVYDAAVCVHAAIPAAADGTVTSAARHLLAMSVAQAEAVLAAASLQPAPADEEVVEALLIAIRHGPTALAGSPPVQQALERLAERLGVAAEGSAAAASLHAASLQRDPQPGDALELAQAAATRSCAYLRCANLAGEGGPAAGQGTGSQRCSKCQVAWYCGTACSHADWRARHRRVCQALGAARVAEQERVG